MIISRCHRQSKEGQAYSNSFKGKKRFLTLWNWNSRIESICLKFDSWLFAICKPQQPSSNKWPWTEQLKCYILKLIVTILPKKKSLSLHQILYHACTSVDVCCVCVFFFYLMSFVRLPWTLLMCKMDIAIYSCLEEGYWNKSKEMHSAIWKRIIVGSFHIMFPWPQDFGNSEKTPL